MREIFDGRALAGRAGIILVLSALLLILILRCGTGPDDYIHDYYPLVYKGDLAFFKEDYRGCYETLKEAVHMLPPPNFEPYRELEKLAFVSAVLNKPEESISYIEQLIEQGYDLKTFQQDSSYAPIWQHPRWLALVERYPERREQYFKGVNLGLRKQLMEMNERDQRYRSRPDRQQYRSEQLHLDSLNIALLREIFEEYGYPGPQLIGHIPPDSTEQLSVVDILMRTPGDIRQDYFIPKLTSFVAQGTCPPRTLGLVVDQYYLSREGYQSYATMTGPKGLFPIKDRPRLDERRLAIGMPTLRQEIQRDSVIKMSFYLKNLLGGD